MAKASPAYSYYPDAFEHGTATMTLSEVGAYQRLLNYQWSNGSIPGDNLGRIAVILRCTERTAKSVWTIVSEKFVKHDQNVWKNARMEEERAKQAAYREVQSARGKASAEKRWGAGQQVTGVITPVMPRLQPEHNQERLQPDDNPKPDGNSLSLSSKKSVPPPSLIRRRNLHAAFEHPRFDVPQVWHEQRTRALSDGEAGMLRFYLHLGAHIEAHPDEDTEPRFDWLTGHFNAWVKGRKQAIAPADVDGVEETRRKIAALMSRKPESA